MQLAKTDVLKDALAMVPDEHRIFLAGCAGEPAATLDTLNDDPALGAGRRFTGVWIPGVNRRNPLAGVETAKADVFFQTPALRDDFIAGRVHHRPLSYTGIWRWLSDKARQMTVFVSVTAPREGAVGLGPAADFTPALIEGGARLVGEVNPHMPEPVHGFRIPVERFEILADAPNPPLAYDPDSADAAADAIAASVAAMIEDGNTVQFGLGKIQAVLASRLAGHRNLAAHGGMIATPLLKALDGGAFSRGLVTGVALGSEDFYQAIAGRGDIRFAPVSHTHNADLLAGIDRLVSIASALEVDLYGQVNAEMANGRQVSGQGGIAEFARGAMASRGGRSIVALPSTARNGTISRIRPALAPESVCSIARSDVDIVVTEHGVARLRGTDLEKRAEALIEIAEPRFRDELAEQWGTMRARL